LWAQPPAGEEECAARPSECSARDCDEQKAVRGLNFRRETRVKVCGPPSRVGEAVGGRPIT
jgi:hypothetical protein